MSANSLRGRSPLRVLFLRPPRHYWPIINEDDNFLLPLAYPTLAAHLRARMEDVQVEILDCCAQRTGWRSLADELRTRRPDVVAIGEKVVYAHEAMRAFQLAREVLPGVVTVAGGHIFSTLPEWSLSECRELDWIVRFEGEEGLRELLETLRADADPRTVAGIAYRDGAAVTTTAPRAPIPDLDSLPIPAYDLAKLDLYSPFGRLWPRAVTIQRGRGCIDECSFCSWWVQEGRHAQVDGRLVPSKLYRSKSVDRVVAEVELLYERYGARYLFWVDATWNLDDRWLDAFCSEIIRRDYKLGWWAFFRTDRVVEQDRKGVLEKMVRAGLRHVLVGVERAETGDVQALDKSGYGYERTREAFLLLERKYPEVFRQGTFLTGMRDDDEGSIKKLLDYAHECHLDFAAFHTLTPFPGTPLWEQAQREGWLEEVDFSKFDMFFPVMPTRHLSRDEIARFTTWCQKNFVQKKPLRYVKGLLSRHPIRRRLHWWFLLSIGRILVRDLWQSLQGAKKFGGFASVNALWKPAWYEG